MYARVSEVETETRVARFTLGTHWLKAECFNNEATIPHYLTQVERCSETQMQGIYIYFN